MIKLIYSDSLDPGIGAGAFLMTGNGELKKAASSVFDCPPDLLKAPKGFVPVHLVALGDEEAFGPNRNADGFPKYANEQYHGTFVTHGHVYEHHRNTDPKKSMGSIVKSAHSPAMSRIELFIHANESKAEKHLARMEKEGSIPVSMACKVPNDRCSICNTLRKTAEDPAQCAHVRDHLGEMDNKGKLIFVHNDQPTYFDISFVGRPADRTAYGFHAKMASAGIVSSIKLAEDAGVSFPESLSIESPEAHRRFLILKKMAQFEDYYKKILTKPLIGSEYRFYELAKAAFSSLDDSDMDSLRNWGPEVVFPSLQKAACILPVRDFYKYAFGADYGEVAQYMPAVIQTLRNGWYSELSSCRGTDAGLVCEEDRYTKEASVYARPVDRRLMSKIAERLSFTYQGLSDRAITNTLASKRPELVLIKIGGSTNSMEIISYLCTKYASYKISTLSKVITCPGVNEDEAIAVAVAQDLVNS